MSAAQQPAGPLVTIVIVNWNGLDDTKECLKYVRRQTYRNLEIVVVDNGSSDGSAEYLRQEKNIVLVENKENLGFTGGHIAGYKAASGNYILLLNNDAVMRRDYVAQAVDALERDETIGALGGRAYLWDEENKLFDETNAYHSYQVINPVTAEGIFKQADEGEPQEVNNVSGSCVMVRRPVIDKVGYLHNPFFAYYEEADLFARMKRAGYRIIYDPGLAIWHANAKTSTRKAPTFFYYMMMRNRFRFALRNFDSWALKRFLKFYVVMGLVSLIKSAIPGQQQPMHWAYAKAFLYNLALGWRVFGERYKLAAALGKSSYTEKIIKEQTPLSLVLGCGSQKSARAIAGTAPSIKPGHEIVAVTAEQKLAAEINSPGRARAVLDRGYFKGRAENLGVVCAKNDWIILSTDGSLPPPEVLEEFTSAIYALRKSKKQAAFLSADNMPAGGLEKILSARAARYLLINRSVLIDAGGLPRFEDNASALRALMAFAFMSSALLQVRSKNGTGLGNYDSGQAGLPILSATIRNKIAEAAASHKKPGAFDKLTQRYYRLHQLRNLVLWVFSFHISLRLKLARVKNLLLATLMINRKKLAIELKHIQNEVIKSRRFFDIEDMKVYEERRRGYLSQHPSETTVFIILRDRLQSLTKLLAWLEKQGLKKVVLIDNDSKLPPLVKFLSQTEYQVLELGRNVGHTCVWSAGIIKILLPDDYYVVSDPDIIPVSEENDVISRLFRIHGDYPDYLKVGLGLKIDDLPDHYTLKADVIRWESQFWKHQIGDGVYEAGVDTTFALYKPFTYYYFLHPSLRTGEPYTARHTPWYADNNQVSDEEVFYRLRLDQSVNSWNKDHLPDRYKAELAKQRH